MSEERTCPIWYKTKLNGSDEPCGGKILRKEPAMSLEKDVGQIKGPNDLTGGYTKEELVPYYLYECEHGHILNKPGWWADVEEVPPGTVKSRFGWAMKKPPYMKE